MKAMYMGSFDPFTLGHLDIVEKALEKYDELIICVGKNNSKNAMFSLAERTKFITQACSSLNKKQNIKVISNVGLAVDIALKEGADVLIRGIRKDSADLYSENQMAETNKLLAAIRGFELKTDFIFQDDPFLQIVSSSLVRSLLEMKEYITMARCLPNCVAKDIIAQKLKMMFLSLFQDYSVGPRYWDLIKEAYSARPYHNLIHLAYMFNQLNIYEQNQNNEKIPINSNLHLAIFLHDYVYNTQQQKTGNAQNEQASANTLHDWQQHQLFLPYINIQTVHQLIMATNHNQKLLTNQQKLMADLDLSILGAADFATYNAYADGIRKEYAAYSDENYKKGRLAFLFSLLKRKHIFHLDFFRQRFEDQARKNIIAEIKRLHDKA